MVKYVKMVRLKVSPGERGVMSMTDQRMPEWLVMTTPPVRGSGDDCVQAS